MLKTITTHSAVPPAIALLTLLLTLLRFSKTKNIRSVAGLYAIATVMAALHTFSASAVAADSALSRPARFRVGSEVVNENVLPFTATIGRFGNSLITDGAGFEPVIFRNKFIAAEDAPNRIAVLPAALTHYETLNGSFFDHATVNIYRIENGHFRLVREDRVAAGGGHATGWTRALDEGMLVPAGTHRFAFRWDEWNRPAARYYFSVKAVDKYGNLSAPATAFSASSPNKLTKIKPTNNLQPFKPVKALLALSRTPDAPQSLRGNTSSDGILALEWDPVSAPDLAGYVVFRSDTPPESHKGYYLQLERQAASPAQHVRAGDLVIISKKIYSFSRQHDLTQRVWGSKAEHAKFMPGLLGFFPDEGADKRWELLRHAPDTPVQEAGETFLELRLGAGVREWLSIYNHGGRLQDWYEVLQKTTYIGEVWLRQEGAGTVQFGMSNFYERPPNKIGPIVFNVGRDWKKFVFRFTPSAVMDGSDPGAMGLQFTGPGTFHVDNFRVYRADTPYLDMLPTDLQALRESGMSALRIHGTIKTGLRSYDMEQFTNPGGVVSGIPRLNTLPQILRNIRQAGVLPWLQVEYHMSPKEWLGLLEFLAAPFDPSNETCESKPWACKRHAQGRTKPWTDDFDKIYFELGNETWNRLFRPWTFDAMSDAANGKSYSAGQVYGMYQEFVIAVLRSSSYWKSAGLDRKVAFVLGGWAANPGYGHDAATSSPSSDFLAIAAYNGGWDEGEGPPRPGFAGLYDTLAQTGQLAIPMADRFAKDLPQLISRGAARGLRLATYEAGPGYAKHGLNNTKVSKEEELVQEKVMKSMAAGTATLDAFLARAYRGFVLQNFFTFARGTYWTSHAKWYFGGQAYPSWKALGLFNTLAAGAMLKTETLSVPVAELKGFSRRATIQESPLVAVYATRRDDRFSLFVLSRKIPDYPVAGDDGFTPVSVDLPFSEPRAVKLYRMTGAPNLNNLLSDNVRIEELDIPPSAVAKRRLTLNAESGADERGLPAASTYVYVFDGVNTKRKRSVSSAK